jgi:hypothetical protein
MFEPLETWRIPTNQQREELLKATLAGTASAKLYLLCDLLGWLMDHGRLAEHDEVIRRVDLAAAIDGFDEPPVERRRAG